MRREIKKSLYLALCAIFGFGVFLILERGVLLALFWCGVDISGNTVAVVDHFATIVTAFLGVWYGIALGLVWYRHIYENALVSMSAPAAAKTTKPMQAGTSAALKSWNVDDLIADRRTKQGKTASSRQAAGGRQGATAKKAMSRSNSV